jgi:hypothetical protein
MTREDIKETVVKGLFLGMILFVSTLISLLISNDMQNLQIVRTFIIPILAAYCLIGIFVLWMRYRSTLRKRGSSLFSGPSIVYWIWILATIIMAGSYGIPQALRYIILTNTATLLIVWLLDCLYLKNIAKELNSGLGFYRLTLVEDLNSKPQTEDMFMKEIESYCIKNHLSLEVIEYGIPAKIKMNNNLYTVKLGQYYSIIGTIVYTLEFQNIVSRTTTSAVK